MKRKNYQRGTDSVNAKLTPREAVLNVNAAELLGRNNIAALNAHGNMLADRGVNLASLPSDPTPGPSTENMLGYAYGTDDVTDPNRDYAPYGSGAASRKTIKAFASRYGVPNSRGNITIPTPSGGTATIGQPSGYSDDQSVTQGGVSRTPVSQSQYIGQGGKTIGPQYDPVTGTSNPKPFGAIGIQGNPAPTLTQTLGVSEPYDPIAAAGNIRQSKLTQYGSNLGAPQPQQPNQPILTGYHWYAATGGVSGGNNANADYNWSDNTSTHEPAGSQFQFPRLGLTRSDQPAIGQAQQATRDVQNQILQNAAKDNANSTGGVSPTSGIIPPWNSPTGKAIDTRTMQETPFQYSRGTSSVTAASRIRRR